MSESDYSEEFSPNPKEKEKAKTARDNKPQRIETNSNKKRGNNDLISIEDFDPSETKKRINSPRSLEACKIEGILAKELLHIPKSKFKEPGLPEEVAELRYEFHENKRRELIELV